MPDGVITDPGGPTTAPASGGARPSPAPSTSPTVGPPPPAAPAPAANGGELAQTGVDSAELLWAALLSLLLGTGCLAAGTLPSRRRA